MDLIDKALSDPRITAAVIGALIGAAAAITGALLAWTGPLIAARISRSGTIDAARRKDQRETYLAFIKAARALERSVPLMGGKPAPRNIIESVNKALADLEDACLAVYLEGPSTAANAAQNILHSTTHNFSNHVFPYLERRTPDFDATEDMVDTWRMEMLGDITTFANVANRSLNAPRPHRDRPVEWRPVHSASTRWLDHDDA